MMHLVIHTTDINQVDFTEVNQTELNIEYSVDRKKFYVSWNTDEMPTSLTLIQNTEGPYTNDEFNILKSSYEWKVFI